MKTLSSPLLCTVLAVCGLTLGAAGQASLEKNKPPGSSSEASKSELPSSSKSAAPEAKLHDGIVKHRGTIMFIKNGRPHRVDFEMKLSEGIIASPNGNVTLKDGSKLKLEEGQMVTLDSKVLTLPESAFENLPAMSEKSNRGANEETEK